MRDWNTVKAVCKIAPASNDGILLEAIAEIEQLKRENKLVLDLAGLLQQDKAELEKQLNKILDNWGEYGGEPE